MLSKKALAFWLFWFNLVWLLIFENDMSCDGNNFFEL